MIIGFGFGNLFTSLIMLLITGSLSYLLFRSLNNRKSDHDYTYDSDQDIEMLRKKKRRYYYEQRQRAWEMNEKYDLTDEEIERRIEQELK